ncbi:MAG TPA: N-acetylmuramoyl-L-alanine amidase [Candidatus Gastranaerophilales bacterium]|nr:N-acetylmuramoyl-L-alanine amidase [Candidatus Gastranaerophilales bacterium]
MKKKVINFLIPLTFIIFLTLSNSAFSAGADFVIKYVTPDKAGKSLFIGGIKKNPQTKVKYKTLRLTNPHRLVVDIENAIFVKNQKTYKSNNLNLKNDIKIAQYSTYPYVVRVVFTADSIKTLNDIKINSNKNNITFEFAEVKLAPIALSSVFKDRNIPKEPEEIKKPEIITFQQVPTNKTLNNQNVIELNNEKTVITLTPTPQADKKAELLNDIKEKSEYNIILNNIENIDNRILISGAGIISLTEPFILSQPDRIIFDIPDAALNSTDLIKTVYLKNNDTARIAQFDSKTVRIVIESSMPDKYTTLFSPDLQSIIISPKEEVSFAEFPDNLSSGVVQDIKIIKENNLTTKFILTAEKPMIHGIKRLYSPDRLIVSLYNIIKPPVELLKSLENTGQYHGAEVSLAAKFPNGSNWLFPLNQSTVIKSKLSLDGRVLEIVLQDIPVIASNKSDKFNKKKIIIDPGHGGYEPGAIRNGIYEKDIALDVAMRVKKHLVAQGFQVIMTREQDKTLSLQERVEITNREKPDLFLSIHVNASNSPNIKGVETHWYTNQSRLLAIHIQEQMANSLTTPDRGIKNSRFFVIRNTNVPAALAEIGYMSNESEMYQIISEQRKEATAKALSNGVINYIKSKNPNFQPEGRGKL